MLHLFDSRWCVMNMRLVASYYKYVYVVLLLLFSFASEKIPVQDGLGFHADQFASRVADFSVYFDKQATRDELHHAFPVVVLGVALKLLQLDSTNKNILMLCIVFSVVCSFFVLVYWGMICRTCNIGALGEVFGAIAISVNAFMKHIVFYPSMIYDIFFMLISFAFIHAWIARRKAVQTIFVGMAMVSHPLALTTFLPLYLFPSGLNPRRHEYSVSPGTSLLFASALFFAVVFYMHMSDISVFRMMNIRKIDDGAWSVVSLVCAAGFTAVASYRLFLCNLARDVLDQFDCGLLLRAIGIASLIVLINMALGVVSKGVVDVHPLSGFNIVNYFFWLPVYDLPLNFLFNKVSCFGPIVVVAMFYWGRILRVASSFGAGILLVFAVSVFRCLDTEMRHMQDVFACLLPFVVLAVQPMLSASRLLIFFVISFAVSRLWMSFNGDFPRYYFWNYGSFFSDEYGYYINVVVFCVTVVVSRWMLSGRFDVVKSGDAE